MSRQLRVWVTCLFVALQAAALLHAADIDKALTQAEGRRRAAETGAHSIQVKGAPAEEAQKVYTRAADAHNAWLAATTGAVRENSASLDVDPLASAAASSLIEWVAVRNKFLGEPILSGSIASSVEASTRAELREIPGALLAQNRRSNDAQRTKSVALLEQKLRWKPWAELR